MTKRDKNGNVIGFGTKRLGWFKGQWYWEIQIGPIVLMYLHDLDHKPNKQRGVWLGRFHAWWDRYWYTYHCRYHHIGRKR